MTVRQLGFGGVCVVAGVVAALVAGAAAQSKAVIWPAAAIKWTMNPSTPGARQAVLWGDPAKGGYGALKEVPGGTMLAMHTHKNDARVVTIKGTIALEIDGKTTDMTAGSYAMLPGGAPHAATCKGTAACEYFEEMSGAFDSAPAKK